MSNAKDEKPRPFSIRRDANFSDLTIECGEKKFAVHRLIVFSASPVIEAAVKDQRFAEGVMNVFKVSDFEADTVDRMVTYMYTHYYDLGAKPDLEAAGELLEHVKVNAIADCYDVACLRELANQKIGDILRDRWTSEGFAQFVQSSYRDP
ncbi:hypothetical protein KEM55_002058 [Ascosphaera atra]|nr:hypothetical protein KEM55_002058 [Ascosphaera atra]